MKIVSNKNIKYIVGIDEVGRGPLAGPVAVGAFKIPTDFPIRGFGPIKDSKKLTPEIREEFYKKLLVLKKEKKIDFAVSYESAKNIDKFGLSKAIKNCLESSIKKLHLNPKECLILLDGGLKAPKIFKQQTIIKGDEKKRAIAFASIVAKVLRDRKMVKLTEKFPKYLFEIHKGYGTKKHRELIKQFGICSEHRVYFCRKILGLTNNL